MGILCIAAMGARPSAFAQDAAEPRPSTDIIIEVDDEGRLLIDGEPVSDPGSRVIIRIDGHRVDRAGPHVRPTGGDRSVGRGRDGLRRFMADFEPPHIPPMEPLLDHLRAEIRGGMETLLEEHRTVANLERKARELARRIRRADQAERPELEAELRAALGEIFDKKMELRRERIEQLAERLEEERAEIDERAQARDRLIERRFELLLGESDELEW